MEIRVVCNAGLAIMAQGQTLLVDAPCCALPPYGAMPEAQWEKLLHGQPPYDQLCGLYFSHTHPDHCDLQNVRQLRQKWPQLPCFFPQEHPEHGKTVMGPFVISWQQIAHAPMEAAPPHVVTWIACGAHSIYVAADAMLDCAVHEAFLRGRRASVGFWNGMYLSRKETRALMQATAGRNYIYHMPPQEPDEFGIWKKCRNNLRRYPQELTTVTVIDRYPYEIEL